MQAYRAELRGGMTTICPQITQNDAEKRGKLAATDSPRSNTDGEGKLEKEAPLKIPKR